MIFLGVAFVKEILNTKKMLIPHFSLRIMEEDVEGTSLLNDLLKKTYSLYKKCLKYKL